MTGLADQQLPIGGLNLDAALPHLRRPFAPAAVKYKVQTVTRKGSAAIVVAHIDARLVIERLNAVVGGEWTEHYEPVPGALECTLSVMGVPRCDVGVAGDPKSLRSDALKRAAVHFGVGVSIYALQAVVMSVGADPHELRTRKQKKKGTANEWVDVPDLDATSRSWLAERYEAWLKVRGEHVFGPALDHGDEADAAGVDDEPLAPDEGEAQEAASPEAEDARAKALAEAQG